MTMYFGPPWNPHIRDTAEQIPTPVGAKCCWCEEAIEQGDQGVTLPCGSIDDKPPPEAVVHYHLDCFLRTVYGSVGHQRKQCSCFGGNLEDPPGLTPRQAALAAVREFEEAFHKEKQK